MAKLAIALVEILKAEGGYVNDPDDSGGKTYCGIAQKMWPNWIGWPYIQKHEPLKKGQVLKNDTFLTLPGKGIEDMVADFYRIHFWDKIKGDEILSQEIATELVVSCVVKGVSMGITLSQRALGLKETGIMDKPTLLALNRMSL